MPINLDGVRMNATQTAPGGVVNAETIFEFRQHADRVEASYCGGQIISGYLIGRVAEKQLEFRFVQLDSTGRLDGGHSRCDVHKLADGRLQLVEHFEWADGSGKGTNVIEELRAGCHG